MIKTDRRTATALLVAVAFFMENLDATIITTALPAIARDFNVAAANLSVGISAYLVALTVFIPISGWAADHYGARRIFSWAIIVFTVSSVLCAFSTGLVSFTLARILQGIGGAMMVPVGRLVVLRVTPKEGIVNAIAILTWPGLVAPLLGPVLGGWIATHLSWHWIFIINVPIGLLVWIAALVLVSNDDRQSLGFDVTGFILSGLGFGMFMAGIELASQNTGHVMAGVWVVVAGCLLLGICAWHLKRASSPLFGLEPLGIRTFRITAVGGSLFRTAIGTAPFLLPLMFQLGFGYTAVHAGALLLWLFAGNLCMKTATTWIMNQFGFRKVLIINGLMVAGGFAVMAVFTDQTPQWLIIAVLFVSGMNRSMHFTALNTIGFADIPQKQMRDATTLFSVLQQMNAGMGIAVGALALTVGAWIRGGNALQPVTADFQMAFWLIAGMALLAVVDTLTLPQQAGESVLKKRSA